MKYSRIIYEPGKVTRIRMNRPRYMNALSHPHYVELDNAFQHASLNQECRVIILSGEGGSFCSGHDVGSLERQMTRDGRTREQLVEQLGSEEAADNYWWEEHHDLAYEMKIRKWRTIPKPTIAMVHGYCIFGGFFAASCMDLVFASEEALFLPPLGQCNLPPWDFSIRKMKEVLFEHRFIPAREAYECGLVSRIYPNRDVLEKETLAFADRVAANESPNYIRNIKEALNITMDFAGFSSAMDNASRLSFEQRPKNVGSSVDNQTRGTTNVARSSIALTNLKLKQSTGKNYLEK